MIITKYILTCFLFFLTALCFAQSDSIATTDSSKTKSISYPTFRYAICTYNPATDRPMIHHLYTRTNYGDTLSSRPVYYNLMHGRDFSHQFNPTNPYGASSPYDAVVRGSIGYLIQTIDKRYFYKK